MFHRLYRKKNSRIISGYSLINIWQKKTEVLIRQVVEEMKKLNEVNAELSARDSPRCELYIRHQHQTSTEI